MAERRHDPFLTSHPSEPPPLPGPRVGPWRSVDRLAWWVHRARGVLPRLMIPAIAFGVGVLLTVVVGIVRPATVTTVSTRPDPAVELAPGLAGALRDGQRAVAIPADQPAPPLEAGQRVDVLAPAADNPSTDIAAPGTGATEVAVVAPGATVLAVDERWITVAVDEGRATVVVRAVLDGRVALTLAGGTS